ncbi:MAG: (d)CMP kinase [Planctomycetaceae bacterium]
MIVTIDGPAGSGKSTVARMLAQQLGFRFLDTGALYRAAAYACTKYGVDPADQTRAAELLAQVSLEMDDDTIRIDGSDVTDKLRTPEITQSASVVAVNPKVRETITELQRRFAAGDNVVTEGRDQGTVVFPNAECKFFLTANPRERAVRRQRDLKEQGTNLTLDEVISQLRERDERDEQRQVAPLKPAADAVIIDTSGVPVEDVVRKMIDIVRQGQSEHT